LFEAPALTFGRSFMEKLVVLRLPEWLYPMRTVKGCPDVRVEILFSCQPFSTAPAMPVSDFPNGKSYVQLNVKLCFAWNADKPRSRVRSHQSRLYWTTLLKSCEFIPLASSIVRENVYDVCARRPCEKRFIALNCREL